MTGPMTSPRRPGHGDHRSARVGPEDPIIEVIADSSSPSRRRPSADRPIGANVPGGRNGTSAGLSRRASPNRRSSQPSPRPRVLQTLRRAGLVTTSREGTTIRYRLADTNVAGLNAQLRDVAAAHLPDVDVARARYLGTDDEDVEQVGREELLRRAAPRRARWWSWTCAPGRSSPPDTFPARSPSPSTSSPSGSRSSRPTSKSPPTAAAPTASSPTRAVRLLTAQGRRAARLTEGMLEWRLAGQAVTTVS